MFASLTRASLAALFAISLVVSGESLGASAGEQRLSGHTTPPAGQSAEPVAPNAGPPSSSPPGGEVAPNAGGEEGDESGYGSPGCPYHEGDLGLIV